MNEQKDGAFRLQSYRKEVQMIGKIKKGKSFGGCIRYVMGKDNANIIASDY